MKDALAEPRLCRKRKLANATGQSPGADLAHQSAKYCIFLDGAGHRRAEARRRTAPGDLFSMYLELLAVEADLNVGNDRVRILWSSPRSRHGSPGLMWDMADEGMRPAHLAFMASCAGHISSETLCSISRKETKTKNCEHKKRKNQFFFGPTLVRRHPPTEEDFFLVRRWSDVTRRCRWSSFSAQAPSPKGKTTPPIHHPSSLITGQVYDKPHLFYC